MKRFYSLPPPMAQKVGTRVGNDPTRRTMIGAGAAILLGASGARAAPRRIFTVVGTGVQGHLADGASVGTATLNQPYGVYVDRKKDLYWADFGSDRILMLDRRSSTVSVVAGNGVKGHSGDSGTSVCHVGSWSRNGAPPSPGGGR